MKILLVCKNKKMEYLGVEYLSAVVKQNGSECKIASLAEAKHFTTSWKPDFIGYSMLTGDQKIFEELNSRLKKVHQFTSIAGNSHATFFPEDCSWADLIMRGESESELSEMIGGKSYTDLDSLPWPDRTNFPDMRIRDFIASRGCSGKCGYCYNSAWNKMFPDIGHVRRRDANDVIAELESIKDVDFFYAQDSCFSPSMKWMREFSALYRSKINIPYHVHLRPEQVNEERVALLHDSNCVSLKIALETSSDRLRKLINRGKQTTEDSYNAAKLLKEGGISLIMLNMVGLPTATIEEDLATLEVNVRCHPAYAWVAIFQPYPMTELAQYCEKEGIYTGDYSELGDNFFDKSVLNFTELHKEQIACLQRIFAFCVEMQVMPEVDDLAWDRLPKFIHNTMRKVGDRRMFPGVIL